MGFSFPSATPNEPNKSSEQNVLFKDVSTTVSTSYFWSLFILPSLCHKSPQSDPRQIRISPNHLAWKRNKQTWSYFLKFIISSLCVCILWDIYIYMVVSSVHFSRSIVYNTLQPRGLQHTRPLCPSPTPGVYSNSCPLSPWCHPAISSSIAPFSSRLQSFPASGSFLMSQLFASGGQSIGVSASTSVLPMNILDWFPLGWTGWMSLQSKGLSSVFSNTTVQKHQFSSTQLSL